MGVGKERVKNVPTVNFSDNKYFCTSTITLKLLYTFCIYVLSILRPMLGVIAEAYSEPSQIVNYFCKTPHLRCLTGFRISLCS